MCIRDRCYIIKSMRMTENGKCAIVLSKYTVYTVSYTHLDVYKRQEYPDRLGADYQLDSLERYAGGVVYSDYVGASFELSLIHI